MATNASSWAGMMERLIRTYNVSRTFVRIWFSSIRRVWWRSVRRFISMRELR